MSFLSRSSRLASMLVQSASRGGRAPPTSLFRLSEPLCVVRPSNLHSPVMMASRSMASKTDADLATFLTEEISAEKQNARPIPEIAGFKVEQDGADLKMTKELKGEKVVIQLNVNHTVDSAEPDDGTEEAPEMKSKPNFEVDLVRGGKTLSFSCSFIPEDQDQPQSEEEAGDVFAIDEVTLFEGEWNDKKYAVAGDILDGYLYDLFMNMMEERGINSAFVDQLSEYCSAYEHSQYIKMLQDLQAFIK